MNTLVTLEIARYEQEARVRHAMNVRALKAYRRGHPVEHHRRQRLASLLRRWASRIDGRPAAPATFTAPRATASSRRLGTR